MIQVYRIDTFDGSNHFKTNRHENWIVRKDSAFITDQEARDYIIEKSRVHCDWQQVSKNLDDFCFSKKYLIHQRFFIGEPPLDDIKDALERHGVKIIK